ncbi:hypothetical protein [Mucilaginibacter humi]|uniref:hypothetical protein n=1 Tax=Mucilaginibacter humi TaxID=2732510 RepID=UPI00293BBA48|nr:hypothetical protein [Mucilaginibacter humi]
MKTGQKEAMAAKPVATKKALHHAVNHIPAAHQKVETMSAQEKALVPIRRISHRGASPTAAVRVVMTARRRILEAKAHSTGNPKALILVISQKETLQVSAALTDRRASASLPAQNR